jgi:competence protein ComEC
MDNTQPFSFELQRFTRAPFRREVSAALLGLSLLQTGQAARKPENRKALQIYFVDVEGGQATLFVTPGGKSLLIDTGWPGNEGRDADRIVAAAKDAGLSKIDFVLITHYHNDHVGGALQLAERMPIGFFIDHGENRETNDDATQKGWLAYQQLLATGKYQRISAKAGDLLPIQGVEFRVVSSDGVMVEKPLPGAGERNTACAETEPRAADQTENARSVGVLVKLGQIKVLDLGDLTWDKEMELTCPVNKLGKVDIYIVSHHGWLQSGSPALVRSIAPRVAIMDNGATKGGSPSSWDIVKKSPRLEDFWQLHFSNEGGVAHNTPKAFIANLAGPDTGHYLKLTAWTDGTFEVFNSRTMQTKRYSPAQ